MNNPVSATVVRPWESFGNTIEEAVVNIDKQLSDSTSKASHDLLMGIRTLAIDEISSHPVNEDDEFSGVPMPSDLETVDARRSVSYVDPSSEYFIPNVKNNDTNVRDDNPNLGGDNMYFPSHKEWN